MATVSLKMTYKYTFGSEASCAREVARMNTILHRRLHSTSLTIFACILQRLLVYTDTLIRLRIKPRRVIIVLIMRLYFAIIDH